MPYAASVLLVVTPCVLRLTLSYPMRYAPCAM
jgi:hypothetical protein